jgi:hypothetical protein
MKAKLSREEWWPVFLISDDGWIVAETELTEDEIKDFNRCLGEFQLWQDRLSDLVPEPEK